MLVAREYLTSVFIYIIQLEPQKVLGIGYFLFYFMGNKLKFLISSLWGDGAASFPSLLLNPGLLTTLFSG